MTVAIDAGVREPLVVEVGDDTWRLQSRLDDDRNLYQYLIRSGDSLLLVDAGLARTPREVVLPALRRLALSPAQIDLIVVTHPDVDHQGGLAGLKEMSPGALAACGWADRALVGDPEKLLADRYQPYLREHGLGFDPEEVAWVRSNSGARAEIDLALGGGETIEVGGRSLSVLHAPGHSAGHLVLFERESGLLFSSDAVHWTGCPAADGSPALCPTYEEIGDYLATIEMIGGLSPAEMHSGHWPMRSGSEITAFLEQSREFVDRVEEVMAARLASPMTAADLCTAVERELGPWSSERKLLMFVVCGHLRHMLRAGTAESVEISAPPPRYRLRREPRPNPAAASENGFRISS